MDAEIKAEWVRALRSGEYTQGFGYLKVQESSNPSAKYCCLGVLCEIAYQQGVVSHNRPFRSRVGRFDEDSAVLPQTVLDWAQMESGIGNYEISLRNGHMLKGSLASLNDDAEATFDQIADVIEYAF